MLALIVSLLKILIVVQITLAPQKPFPSGDFLYSSTSSSKTRTTSDRGRISPVVAARNVITNAIRISTQRILSRCKWWRTWRTFSSRLNQISGTPAELKRWGSYKSTINGLVIDDALNDQKNALELPPHHIDPLVMLQALFGSDGGSADQPLQESLAGCCHGSLDMPGARKNAHRERIGGLGHGDESAGDVFRGVQRC